MSVFMQQPQSSIGEPLVTVHSTLRENEKTLQQDGKVELPISSDGRTTLETTQVKQIYGELKTKSH